MAGRKPKLTPELQRQLVGAISKGYYIQTACQLVGIGESTFYRWLEQGEKAKSGPYREFWEALKRAEAYAEAKRVDNILKAGEMGDWKADAWYLERRYPERWARKERHEHTGKDGGPIEVVDARERLRERLSRMSAQQSVDESEDL